MTLNVIPREEWGAVAPSHPLEYRQLDRLEAWVGHYSDAACRALLDDEKASMRAIQQWHMEHNGWSDIGYHYAIGNSGDILAGRQVQQVGAHCMGYNTPSIGVVFLTDGGIGMAAGQAFVELVSTVEFVVLHRQLHIDRHNEHVQTGCPGPDLGPWIDRVRFPGGALGRTRD